MYSKTTKIIASILVLMLLTSYLTVIGQVGEVLAANLENQTAKTNQTNVEFDVYFDAENKYTSLEAIGGENKLNLKIEVKNAGYLKDAVVELKDSNFKILEVESEKIEKIEENKIYFNQILNGNASEVQIPIQILEENKFNIQNISKISIVKLTAIYVDGNGKENKVEKEMNLELTWTAELEDEFGVQITKFIPYQINENKGLVLQALVQSNIKENKMPEKVNKIEIEVPKINDIEPKEIKVMANTTNATNADEMAINFKEENYKIEDGKITIQVENAENEQKQVAWQKNAKNEFALTFIYPEEVLNSINEKTAKVYISAKNEITAFDLENTKLTKEVKGELELKDQISNLVEFNMESSVESFGKGQLYANYDIENKLETEITETITANVGLAELTDKIIIEQNEDKFTENQRLDASYIKTIKLNKEEINKILGEDFEIKIITKNEEIIINKESKEEEFAIELKNETNTLKIETSKPVAEGKLTLKMVKRIKGELEYTKAQIADFDKLILNIIGKAENEGKTFVEQNVSKEIVLTEPTSQAELRIENNQLSTVVTNRDVKMTAVLKTDSLDCMLYKDPSVQITLPNYIENIDVKNIETHFDTQGSSLKIKSANVMQNSNGTKTIVVNLEGSQTEYSLNAVSKGLNIVITADLTLNKLTPNRTDAVTMVYTNSNRITKTTRGLLGAGPSLSNLEINTVSAPVETIAPVGVITTSSISNYNGDEEELEAMSGDEQVATIATLVKEATANFSMHVINNYNNTIDNIKILGRTMSKGNKDILTGKDLGSTFTAPLKGAITLSGIEEGKYTIYYSENAEATTDLTNSANAWGTTPANFENVKSYLIVINNTKALATGEAIGFNYVAKIPANLQHNESAFENYVVYFNNNLASGMIQDHQASTKLGISTGKGPIVEANMTSSVPETTELQSGEIITYTINIRNTGTEPIRDAVVKLSLPGALRYLEPDSSTSSGYRVAAAKDMPIGNVEAGETIAREFQIKIGNISEDRENVEAIAKITASNIDGEYKVSARNTIVKTYFNIATNTTTEGQTQKEGNTYKYEMNILANDLVSKIEETKVEIQIPEELEYVSVENAEGSYNSSTRKLTINLGQIDGEHIKNFAINVKVGKLPADVYSREVAFRAVVSGKDVRNQNVTFRTIELGKPGLRVTQTSNIPENAVIATGEDFKYTFTIENLSNLYLKDVKITDLLPKELTFASIAITNSQNTTTYEYNKNDDGNPEILVNIPGRKTIIVEVNVIAPLIEVNTKVTNQARITYEGIDILTNSISHTIEKYEMSTENNIPSDPAVKETKRIMGTVWIDKNGDGLRDESEEKVENVELLLFNNETGKLVADSNGKAIKVTTDKDGIYSFTSIPQGKYTVIFLYDTANYSSTAYHAKNVADERNSDAIDTNITLDGVTRVAAITEQITVGETNIYNIDLGLVSNPKFDLKLDKVVSKITVQDSTGTTVTEYKDSKLARKELVAKQIPNSSIIVEYKIKVTNEGAISGFVKKIADYMPQEMKFSSELNKDWYSAENGVLYNSSLASTIINPGETKEVTLVLTKKMTENNLGLYHNQAEIFESYNDLGIADVDSTAGNKVSNEDDISTADVLIAVKTGEVPLFIGLSITIIAAIAGAAYVIKKKVIR